MARNARAGSAATRRALDLARGKRIELDLPSAIEFRSPEANMALKPGDLITVEATPALRVSVDGFVRNPGNFELEAGSGVIQAVAQAGGITVPADQVVAGVRRGLQVLPVDLRKAAFEPGADIPLQSGDIVLLAEPDVIRVQVTGVVQRPGALRLPLQSRVLDAIARAGGLTPSPASARIDILRALPDGRQISLSVDPVALTTLSDARQNLLLRDGDTISVSALQSRIAFVSGQVARPGAYEISPNDGVAEIIARAGGAADAAALKRVTLQREGRSQVVDVRAALTRGGETAGPPLQAGDFVVVPRNTQRVLVLQAVQRPGEVLLPEEGTLTIGEAVSLAGGPRDRAVIREVALFRRFPQGLQRRIIQLDKVYDPKTAKDMGNAKGTVQTGFNLGLNEVLRDGDIVYVPEGKPSRSAYDSISRAVGTLTSLRFLGVF
jgi:protein involved in polysaccharide export with SLBB domain